jgi:HK97 family phage major capsid protein
MKNKELNEENYRSSVKYRDAFFRSFMSGKVAAEDADVMALGKRAVTDMNGLSVTSGAEYLVPQTTLSQIQSIIVKFGRVYGAITKYNFNGDVTIPIGTADAPTNNVDGTDTLTFTFTEVTINQQAVIATVAVKNLLLKNSIAGLEAYLAMEIGKYIGLQLENYVLAGNPGTSKFQGIKTAYGTSEKYSTCDWDLINTVYGAVESPYGDEGTWIMNRKTFFAKFRSMTDAEGRPLISTLPVTVGGAGASQYFIDGRPVIFSTRMSDNEFIYGDLSQYIVNESQELVIEANASEGFSADKTTWRGKVYAGGKCMFATVAFVYYEYEAA